MHTVARTSDFAVFPVGKTVLEMYPSKHLAENAQLD